jgi:DNA-binding beta-propeller fold protein YncE
MSTIDVKTRTKQPTDIPVGPNPFAVAITPDGETALVTHASPFVAPATGPTSVSTIDVKTSNKYPDDITVGSNPFGVTIAPCRR